VRSPLLSATLLRQPEGTLRPKNYLMLIGIYWHVNPSTRSSRAWESRTNSTQGHCSWHSLRRPRSSSALAATPSLVNAGLAASVLRFLLLHKIDEKPCFALFFSKKPCFALFFPPFSPKLGLQNLTGTRIARMLTVTLLSHSLWA